MDGWMDTKHQAPVKWLFSVFGFTTLPPSTSSLNWLRQTGRNLKTSSRMNLNHDGSTALWHCVWGLNYFSCRVQILKFFFQCLNLFPAWGVGVNLNFSSGQKLFFPVSSLAYALFQNVLLPQPDNRSRWSWLYRSSSPQIWPLMVWQDMACRKTPVTYGGWLRNPAPDGTSW